MYYRSKWISRGETYTYNMTFSSEKFKYFTEEYKGIREHINAINILKAQLKVDIQKHGNETALREYRIACVRKLQQERIELSKEIENLFEKHKLDI